MGRRSAQKAAKRAGVATGLTAYQPLPLSRALPPPPPPPPLRVGQPIWCVQARGANGFISRFDVTAMRVVRVEAKSGRAILDDGKGGLASVFPDEVTSNPDPLAVAYFCSADPSSRLGARVEPAPEVPF